MNIGLLHISSWLLLNFGVQAYLMLKKMHKLPAHAASLHCVGLNYRVNLCILDILIDAFNPFNAQKFNFHVFTR